MSGISQEIHGGRTNSKDHLWQGTCKNTYGKHSVIDDDYIEGGGVFRHYWLAAGGGVPVSSTAARA